MDLIAACVALWDADKAQPKSVAAPSVPHSSPPAEHADTLRTIEELTEQRDEARHRVEVVEADVRRVFDEIREALGLRPGDSSYPQVAARYLREERDSLKARVAELEKERDTRLRRVDMLTNDNDALRAKLDEFESTDSDSAALRLENGRLLADIQKLEGLMRGLEQRIALLVDDSFRRLATVAP